MTSGFRVSAKEGTLGLLDFFQRRNLWAFRFLPKKEQESFQTEERGKLGGCPVSTKEGTYGLS
jgi:hypothetical protein